MYVLCSLALLFKIYKVINCTNIYFFSRSSSFFLCIYIFSSGNKLDPIKIDFIMWVGHDSTTFYRDFTDLEKILIYRSGLANAINNYSRLRIIFGCKEFLILNAYQLKLL